MHFLSQLFMFTLNITDCVYVNTRQDRNYDIILCVFDCLSAKRTHVHTHTQIKMIMSSSMFWECSKELVLGSRETCCVKISPICSQKWEMQSLQSSSHAICHASYRFCAAFLTIKCYVWDNGCLMRTVMH